MDINALSGWMAATSLSAWVNEHGWVWQTSEIVHFVGLALVVGVAGVFDLRLLGFARAIPVGALNRLMPWAVVGLALNTVTGILFVFGAPSRYMTNPAFQWKVFFLLVAGLNVLAFMLCYSRKTLALGPGGDAPAGAKVIAATSLVSWFAVMYFGRMLPYLGDAF
jgi:hypothetical protein